MKRTLTVLSAMAMCLFSVPLTGTTAFAADENVLTVSVVDGETGEIMKAAADEEWNVTLEAGYSVEYVTKDGEYGWSTAWEQLDTWDYAQSNPHNIDVSEKSGFDTYRVTDMYIPDGYYLPEESLDIKYRESDNFHTELPDNITVKLKKFVAGDVNADGEFGIADVVLLQKWLLADSDIKLPNSKAADLCGDGVIDVFDLGMMKRELVGKSTVHSEEHTLIEGIKNGMTPDEVFAVIGTDYIGMYMDSRGYVEYYYPFKDTSVFGTNLEGRMFVEFDSETNKLINSGYQIGLFMGDNGAYYPYTESELKDGYAKVMPKLIEWYGDGTKGSLGGPIEENIWNIKDNEIWAIYGVNLWADHEPDVYEKGANEIIVSCSYKPSK